MMLVLVSPILLSLPRPPLANTLLSPAGHDPAAPSGRLTVECNLQFIAEDDLNGSTLTFMSCIADDGSEYSMDESSLVYIQESSQMYSLDTGDRVNATLEKVPDELGHRMYRATSIVPLHDKSRDRSRDEDRNVKLAAQDTPYLFDILTMAVRPLGLEPRPSCTCTRSNGFASRCAGLPRAASATGDADRVKLRT